MAIFFPERNIVFGAPGAGVEEDVGGGEAGRGGGGWGLLARQPEKAEHYKH